MNSEQQERDQNPQRDQNKEWADELHLDSWPPVNTDERVAADEQPQMPQPPVIPQPPRIPQPQSEQTPPPPFFNPAYTDGKPLEPQHAEPMPKTYLVWSVLATVMCCFIPGILAILYSTKVSNRYYSKDYEGAKRASEYAQYCIIASVVLGLVVQTIYLPLMLLVD